MRLGFCPLLVIITVFQASCFPTDSQSFVVVPPIRSKRAIFSENESRGYEGQRHAQIDDMNIITLVSKRFAKTEVTSRVKNAASYAQEIGFSAILPANAYISKFVMEVDGKSYEAEIKPKEEAVNVYNEAVASGRTSGHVSIGARDSNHFKVSVNIEADKKVIFKLTYEELLRRKKDRYEVVINIQPGTYIEDLNVKVDINEGVPLKFVGVPPLRSGNDLSEDLNLITNADIVVGEDYHSATVTFHPSKYDQYQTAEMMGTTGYAVQFVVQYEVERHATTEPGYTAKDYFVYFFAPTDLVPLPKHVIFVLDTSGSMEGQKLYKLQEAMNSILTKLKPADLFNIVEFTDTVSIWNIPGESKITFTDNFEEKLKLPSIPGEVYATEENIQHAKNVINGFSTSGTTNIIAALQTGLSLAQKTRASEHKIYKSIIVFLTDGQPNEGLSEPSEILNKVDALNTGSSRSIIFSLSFGDDADQDFLEKLSLRNSAYDGFRHIYEDADANIQLIDFFDEISAPLLTSIQFQYDKEVVLESTETNFPVYYSGSEIVIAGKIKDNKEFIPKITASGLGHTYEYQAETKNAGVDLERLYVYLSIKQKIEQMKISPHNAALRREILDKAVEYSYVTPFTSLVVVKPNKERNDVRLEDASKGGRRMRPTTTTTTTTTARTTERYEERNFMMISHGIRTYNFDQAPTVTFDRAYNPSRPRYELEREVPWLRSVMKSDGTVVIGEGWYDLGYGKDIIWDFACMNSRNNTIGDCRLIDDCVLFAMEMTSSDEYKKHFCPLNNYAGICCPKGETNIYLYR